MYGLNVFGVEKFDDYSDFYFVWLIIISSFVNYCVVLCMIWVSCLVDFVIRVVFFFLIMIWSSGFVFDVCNSVLFCFVMCVLVVVRVLVMVGLSF